MHNVSVFALKNKDLFKNISIVFGILFFSCIAGKVYSQQDTANNLIDVVVTTGQFRPQSLRKSVYSVRVIDSMRIASRAATSVQEILKNELGVRFSLDPALGESDMMFNGISGQNIKILLDGIPLIDRNSYRNSIGQIDINTIEKIEIVEGPMSVLYGTDALGGVINIITKKENRSRSLLVNARLQEESAGKEYDFIKDKGIHNENIGVQYAHGKWLFDLSGTRNNFGGWKGDTTGRPNQWLPKKQWIGGFRVGYRDSSFQIWNRLNYLDENIYSYGQLINNVGADQTYTTKRVTDQIQSQWKAGEHLGFNSVLSYQYLQRKTMSTIYNAETGIVNLNPDPTADQALAKFSDVFFRTVADWYFSEKISLQPGAEIQWDKAFGDRIEGTPTITNYSLFLSSEFKPYSNLNIRPALRFIHNTVYPAPKAVPSINTKWKLSDAFDLRLSYGYGYRAPALRELYFSFHDANHSIDGNPDLKAETSNSYNASLEWHYLNNDNYTIRSTVSSFYSSFKDKIGLAQAANSTTYSYINISKSKAIGLNWNSVLKYKNLEANIGAAYIGYYNSYKEDTTAVSGESKTFAWSPEVNTNLTYAFTKIKTTVGLFYKFTGKLPTYMMDGANNVYLAKQGSFHDMDITATKTIGRHFQIQGGVKNIFNVTTLSNTALGSTEAHGSGGGAVLQSYGRSWFIGLILIPTKIF